MEFLFFLFLILFFLALAAFFVFVITAARGAPYVKSRQEQIDKMIDLARPKEGDRSVDLGSGDGSIVSAFVGEGTEAHGYEINFFLVLLSRKKLKRASGNTCIHYGSFWGKDLSGFDIVTVFGLSHIMRPLEKKLQGELKPGARIISNGFKFPNWKVAEERGGVYLYVKK